MPQPSDTGDLDVVMDVEVDGEPRQGSAPAAPTRTVGWVVGAGVLVAVVAGVLAWNPATTLEVEQAMVADGDMRTAPLPSMPTVAVAEAWSVELGDGERIEQLAVTSDAIVAVVAGQSAAAATMRAWHLASGRESWRLDAVAREDLAPVVQDRAMPHVLAEDRVTTFDDWSGDRLAHRVVRVEDGTDAWKSPGPGSLQVHPWHPEVVFRPTGASAADEAPGATLVDLASGRESQVPTTTLPWTDGWVSLDDVGDTRWTLRAGRGTTTLSSQSIPVRLGEGWLTGTDGRFVLVDGDGDERWTLDSPGLTGSGQLHGLDVAVVLEGFVVGGDGASPGRDPVMHLVEPFGQVTELPELDPWLVRRYGLVASPALPTDEPIVHVCTGANTVSVIRPCPGEVEVRALDGGVRAERAVSPLQRFEDTTEPVVLAAQGLAVLSRDGVLGLDWTTLDTLWRVDRQGLRREPQVTRWATSADGVAVAGVGDEPGAPSFLAWYAP